MTVSGVIARPLNNSQMRMLGYQDNSAGQSNDLSNHDFQNSDDDIRNKLQCSGDSLRAGCSNNSSVSRMLLQLAAKNGCKAAAITLWIAEMIVWG